MTGAFPSAAAICWSSQASPNGQSRGTVPPTISARARSGYGIIESELRRNNPAKRDAADDRLRNIQRVHQVADIRGEIGRRPRPGLVVRAACPTAIEHDHPIELRKIGNLKRHVRQVIVRMENEW